MFCNLCQINVLYVECFYCYQDKTVVVADFGLARIMPQNNWTAERKKFGRKHARKKRSAL